MNSRNILGLVMLAITLFLLSPQESFAQKGKKKKKKKPAKTEVNSGGQPVESKPKVTDEKRTIVSAYPFSLVGHSLMAGIEYMSGPAFGIKGIAGIGAADSSTYYGPEVLDFASYYLELQTKFYINEGPYSPNGIYLAPFVAAKGMGFTQKALKENPVTHNVEYVSIGNKSVSAQMIGYVLGAQVVIQKTISADVYVGGGYMHSSGLYQGFTKLGIDSYRNGFSLQVGFNVGYAF